MLPIGKQMTLDEYKTKVKDLYEKIHPQYTSEAIENSMNAPEALWQQRMKDFSPREVAQSIGTGLI